MTQVASEVQWDDLVNKAYLALEERGLEHVYHERLAFELSEMNKQGATTRWLNWFVEGKRFSSNPNSLVLPWLLGMVDEDPILNRSEPMLNTVRASLVREFKDKHGHIPSDLIKDSDMPDIDLDCLPEARDPIKEYSATKYGAGVDDGYGAVCSVGTWQTYKFKSALVDACVGTGTMDRYKAYELTNKLPDEVDQLKDEGKAACKGRIIDHGTGEERECGVVHGQAKCPQCGSADTDGPTLGKLLSDYETPEYDALREFAKKHQQVVSYAAKLVGRIRNMGMHAGAIIIADRPLYGNIPLAKSAARGHWISMWTEGRNTQLSKFGYNKWDILGLKTLKYVFECCKLIEQNRGISFGENMEGWDYVDPKKSIAGWYIDGDGEKRFIDLNDPYALRLANERKTDGVFQFDTELAKSILANGVRNFNDLLLFNAMGHPGPMQSIPTAVANRDDKSGKWKEKLSNIHPILLEILGDTYGVICYQEQLASIWQRIGGFTAPEAQDARKAVAKKWAHKLRPIRSKWIDGASKSIGAQHAKELWSLMESFGRYAFNRSHGVSYCLVAHRCLWLKAHFAPEWWAAVMSYCHADKLVRYMGIARSERWEPTEITNSGAKGISNDGMTFGTLNPNNMTRQFTVTGNIVNQGLIGIKGIGATAAAKYEGRENFRDIDEFIEKKGGKDKSCMERFIKLGAFRNLAGHENSKALWLWYQYKYCSGKDITKLRREVKEALLEQEGWNEKTIQAERDRMISEYRKQYPNRRKIPAKFSNWTPKPDDRRERVMALCQDDFSLSEVLQFEEEYLGYFLHSPLDLYKRSGGTIEDAKAAAARGEECRLEVVIVDVDFGVTRNGKEFAKLIVSDGVQQALVMMWSNEMAIQDANNLTVGLGVQMYVDYDEKRNSFSLGRGEIIIRLLRK